MPRNHTLALITAALSTLAFSPNVNATQPARLYSKHAGPPRAWQVGIPATPISTVNMANSNVISFLSIVGWSGKGPSLQVNLIHNAIAAISDLQTSAACGFSLGEGWSTSYSGQVVSVNATTVHLIEDDGTTHVYEKINNVWTPPPGVHDQLTFNAQTGWLLKRKDQSYRKFDATWGRLTKIGDAAGNEITLAYDSFEALHTVTDASGRSVTFNVSLGKLQSITDVLNRTWSFHYDKDNRLDILTDPMTFTRHFAYTDAGRIGAFTDREQNTWTMNGKTFALMVNDPVPFEGQVQQFWFPQDVFATGYASEYTDRRGEVWKFEFHDGEPHQRALKLFADPLDNTSYYTFDSDRNLTNYVDQLGTGPADAAHRWTLGYDPSGNCTSVVDPLNHKWQATYDSLNNLTSVAPPADNQQAINAQKRVDFTYTNGNDPTLLTAATQPADGNGNPAAVTQLRYYGPTDLGGNWNRNLKQVIDANNVTHTYTYDQYGQFYDETEGPEDGTLDQYRHWAEFDAAGRLGPFNYDKGSGTQLVNAACCCHCTAGHSTPNANNNVTSVACPIYLCTCACPLATATSCTGPGFIRPLRAGCFSATYDHEGRPLTINRCIQDENDFSLEQTSRDSVLIYNELGILTDHVLTTDEPTRRYDGQPPTAGTITRLNHFDSDFTTGVFERTGPDNQVTRVETNARGLPTYVERGAINASASYTPDGLPATIMYGNMNQTVYEYDNARRLERIVHYDFCGHWRPFLTLVYSYTPDGLISRIDEEEYTDPCATNEPITPKEYVTTFTYDRRNQLTNERRERIDDAATIYDLAYTYDQLGNRLTKVNHASVLSSQWTTTTYRYDVQNPTLYGSNANRLMGYHVKFGSLDLSDVTYTYNAFGSPATISTHRLFGSSTAAYSIARLYYDNNQRLWLVLNETGDRDSEGNPTNCVRTRCTEFRYDSGRARYMTRSRNPNTLVPNNDAEWSDYDGDSIDLDYTVNRATGAVTLNRRHVAGLAQQDATTAENTWFHADQIDSSRVLCDDDGRPVRQIAYTAFGEGFAATGAPETRYTYVGGWGYEAVTPPGASSPLSWLHVGERWYDPSTGRFLQRDPISIRGGLNTYAYVRGNPTRSIDPRGLRIWTEVTVTSDYELCGDDLGWVERAHFVTYDDHGSGEKAIWTGVASAGVGLLGLIPILTEVAVPVSLELAAVSYADSVAPPTVLEKTDVEIWREPVFILSR